MKLSRTNASWVRFGGGVFVLLAETQWQLRGWLRQPLLFAIGLLVPEGFNPRLVGVITAVTVAHSLTLALGTLGLLTLRPPPVEAVIAVSTMLMAAKAWHQKPTMSRPWPALMDGLTNFDPRKNRPGGRFS